MQGADAAPRSRLRTRIVHALPILLYATLTLAIAYPLLGEGYVFALDHAMGPRSVEYYAQFTTDNSNALQSKGGYALLLRALDAVMSPQAAQKVILFAPFFLAGLGMHRLVGRKSLPAASFAGTFYMLSPFMYLRAVAGQTGMTWAYALTPWFLLAWMHASETGSRRAFAAAVLLLTATAIFQAHGAFFLAALVALHALATALTSPHLWRPTLKRAALLGVACAIVNAYWLVPVALAPETLVTHIGDEDRAYFSTRAHHLPSVGMAALTLQGFWREGYAGYYAQSPWMLAVPLGILLLAVHGFMQAPRSPRARTVAAAGVIGFALAVGGASSLTSGVFDWAWDHVPFFKGFRDNQKFLALLALAYAYLAAGGVEDLLARVQASRFAGPRRLAPAALAVLLLAAPVATATPLMGGFDDQLQLSDYPEAWREVEAVTRACDGALLVLPWHLYIGMPWVNGPDKRITNPAKLFFTCPVLSSDDVEAGEIHAPSVDPARRYVGHWINDMGFAHGNARDIRTMGNLLSPLNVQYVLVLKAADWRGVAHALDGQSDLRRVLDNAHAVLYENTAPRAALWRTERVVPLGAWEDLLPLSHRESLAGTIFVDAHANGLRGAADGPRARVPTDAGAWALDAEIPPGQPRYVLHTPGPGVGAASLTLDGAAPAHMSLATSAVFENEDGGRLAQGAFRRVALPAYAVSLAGALALAAGAWRERERAGPIEAAAP